MFTWQRRNNSRCTKSTWTLLVHAPAADYGGLAVSYLSLHISLSPASALPIHSPRSWQPAGTHGCSLTSPSRVSAPHPPPEAHLWVRTSAAFPKELSSTCTSAPRRADWPGAWRSRPDTSLGSQQIFIFLHLLLLLGEWLLFATICLFSLVVFKVFTFSLVCCTSWMMFLGVASFLLTFLRILCNSSVWRSMPF